MRRRTRIIREKKKLKSQVEKHGESLVRRPLIRESGSQQRCLLCLAASGRSTLEVLAGPQSCGVRGCGHSRLALSPWSLICSLRGGVFSTEVRGPVPEV